MKIFKLMMVAFVAMLAFTACNNDCDHDFIEYDYSKALVGTWTSWEDGLAEAMVIKEDGSFTITGVTAGGSRHEQKGTLKTTNNKLTLTFDNGEKMEGRLELVAGETMSIVLNEKFDIRVTYHYCKEDLSDEIVGMWVCNETPSAEENDMLIMTYNADGTTLFTGYAYEADAFSANVAATYEVIGDMLIHKQPDIAIEYGLIPYSAMKLVYTPNATALGDVMTLKAYAKVGEDFVETTTSWLRVKQNLDLANMSYDYISCYITNAKGVDKDIKFLNTTFNFAKMDGSIIDKFLRSILFSVNFPDANTIEYRCLLEGNYLVSVAPIEVEGNKMTLKMSSRHEAYRDVEIYTFQDADNTQMHMYMPTTSFENFFSNMSLSLLSSSGQVDINNPVHVEAVYKEVADAVESINLSIVCKNTTTRAL